MTPGRLFVVSTPIGHLGDFSYRGVEVLRAARIIACEDTRRTRRLLAHYDLDVPLLSLHAHSADVVIERLLDRVASGEDAAYVTDAGTPGVSDPGGRLAERAHARGIAVVPVPGASAVLAALAASGLPADRFVFAGFLPRRGRARTAALERLARESWTVICYEAPGRTAVLLGELAAHCGLDRPAAVARELTKLHEEIRRGTLATLAAYYHAHAPRGEVTIVMAGTDRPPAREPVADTEALVAELRERGPPALVAKELARRLGVPRREAYRLLRP